MKLTFTRSEANPNIWLKVANGRPFILVTCEDNLFLVGTYTLTFYSKRELISKYGMVDCKLITTPMELNFKNL